jgi:hypothetical protein
MKNKKPSGKEIIGMLLLNKIVRGASDEVIRESLKEEGLNPDEVYKEHRLKVEHLIKQAEENKKKNEIKKSNRPRLS